MDRSGGGISWQRTIDALTDVKDTEASGLRYLAGSRKNRGDRRLKAATAPYIAFYVDTDIQLSSFLSLPLHDYDTIAPAGTPTCP